MVSAPWTPPPGKYYTPQTAAHHGQHQHHGAGHLTHTAHQQHGGSSSSSRSKNAAVYETPAPMGAPYQYDVGTAKQGASGASAGLGGKSLPPWEQQQLAARGGAGGHSSRGEGTRAVAESARSSSTARSSTARLVAHEKNTKGSHAQPARVEATPGVGRKLDFDDGPATPSGPVAQNPSIADHVNPRFDLHGHQRKAKKEGEKLALLLDKDREKARTLFGGLTTSGSGVYEDRRGRTRTGLIEVLVCFSELFFALGGGFGFGSSGCRARATGAAV